MYIGLQVLYRLEYSDLFKRFYVIYLPFSYYTRTYTCLFICLKLYMIMGTFRARDLYTTFLSYHALPYLL